MTENWTSEHRAIALEQKLTPAACWLWQWLLSQGEGVELEPDLKDFNDWITEHRGKPYNPKTLKNALQLLSEKQLISLGKKYNWSTWDMVVRPLQFLKKLWNKIPLVGKKRHKPSAAKVENSINYHKRLEQQQQNKRDLQMIESELLKVGIKFQPKYLKRLLKFTLDEIRESIQLYEIRSLSEGIIIRNPAGWMMECLRNAWWLG